MQLHPECEPLAFLLGTWKGPGAGEYPTIEPFHYLEEVVFAHVGKPFLSYGQKTRHRDTGEPLHAETGYLRAVGGGRVEFVVVQPSGIVELHNGTVDGESIGLEVDQVHTTATAKSVAGVDRSFKVVANPDSGDLVLTYDVSMAAVGQAMTHHLHADLVKQQAE